MRIFVAIPIYDLPKKPGWYNVIGDCNPGACGRMWFDGKEFNVPTNYMNIDLYWLSETEIA